MIKTVIADGKAEYEFLKAVRDRSSDTDRDVTAIVSDIINNVRKMSIDDKNAYLLILTKNSYDIKKINI